MPVVHFLNVGEGDCSIIKHYSDHITIIDVSWARTPKPLYEEAVKELSKLEKGTNGNFNQKAYPTNPVSYMTECGYTDVFRFILTHPDMDHLDGIEAFFTAFPPTNFWDTDNKKEIEFINGTNAGFKESDWQFYKKLRDTKPTTNPKRLALLSGARNMYYNQSDEAGTGGGDGLYILAPTPALIASACECDDYNDSSYVILYRTDGHRILFAGDSHDTTWEHILAAHKTDVENVDILIAPHHGRKSDRDWKFLDVVNPKLTFFGNAASEHLGYQAWYNRNLSFITNNQAGNIVAVTSKEAIDIFVSCEAYAKANNASPWQDTHGFYLGTLK